MTLRSRHYEIGMVAILGLALGLNAFEQFSISYLLPFIKPALHLSNTQVGLVVSGYWVGFAVSSYLTGTLADALGKRKAILLTILTSMSLCSVATGLAGSFNTLLGARALMGFWEGALLTITQSIVALESSAEHRGGNMGIVASVCPNVLGFFVAPLVLVQIAVRYGWRAGFFVVVVPGLICACLAARFLREPTQTQTASVDTTNASRRDARGLREAFRYRNFWLSAALCCLFVAYISLGFTFLPLFYVNVRGFSAQQMSFLMGLLGISAVLYALLLPIASDRMGRKPIMVAASLVSVVCPLSALYFTGPVPFLSVLLFVGWGLSGTGSFFMGTIPAETVPVRTVSTAIGLIIAMGVVVGGLAGPSIAGWSADHWGAQVPLLLQAGCAAAAAIVSMALLETAPRKIKGATACSVVGR